MKQVSKADAIRTLTLDEILAVSGGKTPHPLKQTGKGKGKGKGQSGLSGLLDDAEKAFLSFFS